MDEKGKRGVGMNISVQIYDHETETIYDVSPLVSDMTITTYLEDNPGKLEFAVVNKDPLSFSEGATVSVVLDGYKMFKGFVFKRNYTEDTTKIKVTCYDQLRYLKNKDSRKFENVTCDQIFSQLCKDFVLTHKVVDKSSHICRPRSEDATSLYEMIKNALDDTLISTNQWYFIRDNYGTLEHLNVYSCALPYLLGDSSYVTGYDYQSSIDDDVYNQIKLYRDNEASKKREVFIVNDTVNGGARLKQWGILQLYEKVDEKYNEAQIEELALKMLKHYCSPRRTLTLKCLGIKEFFAGCLFQCRIANLGGDDLDKTLLVTECTHKISNEEHTMTLKTEVVTK